MTYPPQIFYFGYKYFGFCSYCNQRWWLKKTKRGYLCEACNKGTTWWEHVLSWFDPDLLPPL